MFLFHTAGSIYLLETIELLLINKIELNAKITTINSFHHDIVEKLESCKLYIAYILCLFVRMGTELSSHQDMEVNESLSEKHLKVI